MHGRMRTEIIEETVDGFSLAGALASASRPPSRMSDALRQALESDRVTDRARAVRRAGTHPDEGPSFGQVTAQEGGGGTMITLPPGTAKLFTGPTGGQFVPAGSGSSSPPADKPMSTGVKVAIGAGAAVGVFVLLKLVMR